MLIRRVAGFLLGLAVLAGAGLSATTGQAQTVDEIIKRGKAVIAIDTTVPPMA